MKALKNKGFVPQSFSPKQKLVLTWWLSDKYKTKDGIICDGSIRSGKTTVMSLSFVLWAMKTFDGENFAMCGKTISSLRRNVLKQLFKMLKAMNVSIVEHRSENYFTISDGKHENDFYIFGGKDEASQDLIQGITLAGVFFDEVALMPESFVSQATARCSVEGSKMWFNCNPEGPDHWFKTNWIEHISDLNLIRIHFTMKDNPSLSKRIRERYERMYHGVFYDRFILGLWVLASGIIFRDFAEDDTTFLYDDSELLDANGVCKVPLSKVVMGIDFGGNGSKTTFVLNAYMHGYKDFRICEEDSLPLSDNIGAEEICNKFIEFYRMCLKKYRRVDYIFPDSASTTMINSLRAKAKQEGLPWNRITGCRKNEIKDRPKSIDLLLSSGRLKINSRCVNVRKSLASLRWDEDKPDIPEDKNIGNCNDWYDATCYTMLDFIEYIDLIK